MEEKQEFKRKKKTEISLGMAIFLIALSLFVVVTVIVGAIIIHKKISKLPLKGEILGINEKEVDSNSESNNDDIKLNEQEAIIDTSNESKPANVNEDEVIGKWKVIAAEDYENGEWVSIYSLFGTSAQYGIGNFEFFKDGTFAENIAPISESEYKGTWKLRGDEEIAYLALYDENNNYEEVYINDFKKTEGIIYLKYKNMYLIKDEEYSKNVEKITQNLPDNEILYVTSVEPVDGNLYTLKGVIYKKCTVLKEDIENAMNDERINIYGKWYAIEKTSNPEVYDLWTHSPEEVIYKLKKINDEEFYVERQTELTDVWRLTNKYMEITIEGDIPYIEEYTDTTVGKYYSDFKDRVPVDAWWLEEGTTFEFENGKCVKVIERMTSI